MMIRCILLSVFVAGCSGDGPRNGTTNGATTEEDFSPGEILPICDGSSDLRFAAFLTTTGNLGEAKTALAGAGFRFLYVDGKCHYWVLDELANHETREGDLTEAQAEQLAQDFTYGGWGNFEGAWPEPSAIDADWVTVHDTKSGYACYAGCSAAPESVREAAGRGKSTAFHRWNAELYAQGTPSVGPIRLVIEQWAFLGTSVDEDLKPGAVQWPLAASPTEIAPWIATSEDRSTPARPSTNPEATWSVTRVS